MLADLNANAVVYQVLDDIIRSKSIPAGARAALFDVVDELRSMAGDASQVRRAEQISIEIHKLEWALRRGDAFAADASRQQLRSHAAEWINTRIFSAH